MFPWSHVYIIFQKVEFLLVQRRTVISRAGGFGSMGDEMG